MSSTIATLIRSIAVAAAVAVLPWSGLLVGPAVAADVPARAEANGKAGDADRPNPDYAKWARLRDGAWVRVRILGTLRTAEWTTRLVKVTDAEAVLEVTEWRPGREPREPWQERVPAKNKAPADAAAAPAEAGDERLPVGDTTVACHWETRRAAQAGGAGDGAESGETVWTHAAVPGFVKKVSWLPADAERGLPAARTTEVLVAYDLPPREGVAAAAAGEEKLPPAAGPPVKFSWTYAFDPPGRRDWTRLSADEWEERWETGQVLKFRVVGWIADGERYGTVVRRASDEGLETIIPDAGKEAWLIFRLLPDGKWTHLGKIEESTSEVKPATGEAR